MLFVIADSLGQTLCAFQCGVGFPLDKLAFLLVDLACAQR